jgi:deoxyribodipyrimidine photo-lyase
VHTIGRGGRPNTAGRYVLYWTQIFRRPEHNHALNYAVERANDLGLPVVVYEGLRHDYPWASDRIHSFILEGARQSAGGFARRGIPHLFFLQRNASERRQAVKRLARGAALVVTDLFPSFIIPGQTRKAASQIAVPLHAVDSCGVFPLALFEKEEYAARTLRPKVRRLLAEHLVPFRDPAPGHQGKDPGIDFPWAVDLETRDPAAWAAECAIDHSVPPVPGLPGGCRAARAALERFIEKKLARYAAERNHPDADAGSGLSPYLHFGHISAIDVALAVDAASAPAACKEAFLEELIVRRELSYNFAWRNPEHESLRGLPAWALENLARHDADRRRPVYGLATFERAETHDEVWNAAQRQLLREGRIHNYLRMLWGKKVIEWSASHAEAFRILVHLNNKYGLDGRDPNSWTGILWCFGKHDRPWQKTPVLGTARPMSTERARKKIRMERYLERFGR